MAGNGSAGPQKQRRRHLRVKVAVTIELLIEKYATPLRGRTSDLSLGGCYVESMFTLELGTQVKVTLWLNDAKVVTEGVIVTRHIQVGNGIQFTNMSAQDSATLRKFLATAPEM